MSKSIIIAGAALTVTLAATIGTLVAGAKPYRAVVDTTTIDTVDLDRYMGRWYEIARFDHPFERDMELVTAVYTFNPDGTVRVANGGYNTRTGRYKESIGRARRVDGRAGELEVTFFLNFWSPYKILELDDDYTNVLIGGGSDRYLWILSRTPEVDEQSLRDLLRSATARGYDTSKLIWVRQM
jgi:lipocalin